MTPEDIGGSFGPSARVAALEVEVSNLHHLVRALAALPAQLATVTEAQAGMKEQVSNLRQEWRDDVHHFDAAVSELKTALEKANEEHAKQISKLESAQTRAEDNRKADVKWVIGTMIAVGVLVVAILGLLLA